MKILIASDGLHAHYFQRQSWLRAFNECGIEASFWHCKEVSAFDAGGRICPIQWKRLLSNLARRFRCHQTDCPQREGPLKRERGGPEVRGRGPEERMDK